MRKLLAALLCLLLAAPALAQNSGTFPASSGGGGTPASPTGSLQYNNSAAFGAVGSFYNGTSTLSLGNTVTAQSLQVYNTVDTISAPTNFERGVFNWTTTANVLTIGTQAGGTGSVRNLQFVVGATSELDFGITNSGAWSTGAPFFTTASVTLAGGAAFFSSSNGFTQFPSAFVTGWTNGSANGVVDTGLSRNAAGVIEVNGGTKGTITGSIKPANFVSGGSVPVDGGGSCTASSFAGGATAGTFAAAVCAGGTIAITFAFTAPTGWSCDAEDRTTPSTGKLQQTVSTTTKATFLATNSAADVIQYKCIAY